MNDAEVHIDVAAAELRAVLKRMAKLGTAPGPGTWSVGSGLRIAWMGMSDIVDGDARGSAVALVDGDVMRGLSKVSSTWSGRVVIQIAGGELRIGSLVVEAELRSEEPPQLLPLNAEPGDILRLHVREEPERISDAGLDEAVAENLERLARSCARACKHLAWLRIPEGELQGWLLDRYRPQSDAEPLVVETTGQIRLFDDA